MAGVLEALAKCARWSCIRAGTILLRWAALASAELNRVANQDSNSLDQSHAATRRHNQSPVLPTSVLALCFSSLTQESRYAGFAWFAMWILGWFTYVAATSAEALNAQQAAFAGRGDVVMTESAWTHLSLYHTLGRVQRWVFGFADFSDVLISTLILIVMTVLSLAVLYRRISAPMRV